MADHAAKQPEPVLTRAAVVTALSVLSALLVKSGAGDVSAWLSVHSDEVAGAVLAVGPAVSAWLARKHVTPLLSPKNAAGEKLETASLPDVSDITPDAVAPDASDIQPAP